MGRSQGKGLAKSLIGSGEQIAFKTRNPVYEVITGDLKRLIIQLTQSATTREELYSPIIKELRNLNPAELTKDPSFQRLIDFEAEKIQAESKIDIKKYLFDNLTDLFFHDLKKYQTPNLARALISDEQTPKLFKNDLVSGCLDNFYNSEDKYLDFAIESLLPLAQEDGYLKSTIINNFSQTAATRLIKKAVLEDAFPGLKKLNQQGQLNVERSLAAKRLYKYLCKDLGEQITKDDLIYQIANAQGQLMTEYIFGELTKEKGPLKSSKALNHNSFNINRQDKINYLNSAIKKSGDGFDKEILKKVYLYFGGNKKTWENDHDSFKHLNSLSGEDILNFIEEFNQKGAECPLKNQGQKYNFPINWLNEITFGKAFNPPV